MNQLVFIGACETGLQYAVFEFLERQGAYFGIDGDTYPIGRPSHGRPYRARSIIRQGHAPVGRPDVRHFGENALPPRAVTGSLGSHA